ncbi:MAG: hypothetical protein RMM98_12550 [Acidobacteriota bacterium]|nr:hypothetical protein [Blastocatellia bacterium]MDW8240439.1 hypothetical protein [Acidobacteriota bacterium]
MRPERQLLITWSLCFKQQDGHCSERVPRRQVTEIVVIVSIAGLEKKNLTRCQQVTETVVVVSIAGLRETEILVIVSIVGLEKKNLARCRHVTEIVVIVSIRGFEKRRRNLA